MPANRQISFEGVHRLLRSLFAEDLHAKRILSLAGATLGVIESASLAVALIGQGLALARGLVPKYAIKQVDRMLSNQGIDVDALLVHWVPYVVGKSPPTPPTNPRKPWSTFTPSAGASSAPSAIPRTFVSAWAWKR